MHSAPSVTYPVGRSLFAGALLLAISVASAAVMAMWAWRTSASSAWPVIGLLLLIPCCGWTFLRWLRTPTGKLGWDGRGWTWSAGTSSVRGSLQVNLDLQRALLLRLRADTGSVLWFWVDCYRSPDHWPAFRRAVYSPATSPVVSGADPSEAKS